MNYLIEDSLSRLRKFCEHKEFKGWDPYDGLKSRLFQKLPLKKLPLARLLWIQFFKNSPFNLRNLLAVPPEYNPKGIALFLSGYVNLYRLRKDYDLKDKIDLLKNILLSLQSKNYSGICWGYPFDWQSRTFFIPAFTPNVVVSTFVGNAFLDVYELLGLSEDFKVCRSICTFLLNDLHKSSAENGFCFSYTPLDRSRIFNASLLASRFLVRVFSITKESILKEEAKKSVEFCVRQQNKDGSWFYGLDANQKWVDSFHSAYNLEALYDYQRYTGDASYQEAFMKGVTYYFSVFFNKDGLPRLYPFRDYPADVHSAAEALVLLCKTGFLQKQRMLANAILSWTIRHMQDREGYFYFQKNKCYTLKTAYMRWTCSWMFYALTLYLSHDIQQVTT